MSKATAKNYYIYDCNYNLIATSGIKTTAKFLDCEMVDVLTYLNKRALFNDKYMVKDTLVTKHIV